MQIVKDLIDSRRNNKPAVKDQLDLKIDAAVWHSNDNAPHVICDVLLEDGMEVEAIYIDGHWEIIGGRIVDPLSFKVKEVVVFANN